MPFVILLVLGTSIWVLADGYRYEMDKNEHPIVWFIGCLLLWIVAFPWYLAKRNSYKLKSNSGDKESPRKESQMEQDQKKKGMSGLAKFGIGCGGLIVLIIIISIISSINGVKKTLGGTTSTGTNNTTNTKPSVKKFNIDEIYSQLNTGMTEAQVEEIITQKPINCTESELQGFGTTKLCTYGNVFLDSGSIMVTYMNGKVSSKTKSQY